MERFRSQHVRAASNVASALGVTVLAVAAFGRQTISKTTPPIPTPGAVHRVAGQPGVAGPPAASPVAAKTADDRAYLVGDDYVGNARTGIMTAKNFKYTEQDRVVTGDSATYNSKTKELDADGNLVMDDPKHHMTATHCHVDQKKKLSVFTGSVVIELKPAKPQPAAAVTPGAPAPQTETTAPTTPPPTATGKNASGDQGPSASGVVMDDSKSDGKSDAKSDSGTDSKSDGKEESDDLGAEKSHGVTIYCDHAEDYYKKDFIVLTGHLVFKQKVKKDDGSTVERTLTAEHAEYDGSKDEMVLFTPVAGHDSDGATLEFEKNVIVGTKEGDETLKSVGHTTIHFPLDEVRDKDTTPANGAKKSDAKPDAPVKKPAVQPQPTSGTGNP